MQKRRFPKAAVRITRLRGIGPKSNPTGGPPSAIRDDGERRRRDNILFRTLREVPMSWFPDLCANGARDDVDAKK